MKIKKSEYKKRIETAFEIGMRIGLDSPEYARLYLTNENAKNTLKNIAKNVSNAFSKIAMIGGGE